MIIMDVKMPGMNGIEVLKKLREINQNVKVIMMTAYGDQHYINEAEGLGIVRFIIKPFDLTELKKQVEEIVENS